MLLSAIFLGCLSVAVVTAHNITPTFNETVGACAAVKNVDVVGEETIRECGGLSAQDCCSRQYAVHVRHRNANCSTIVLKHGCCFCYDIILKFAQTHDETMVMTNSDIENDDRTREVERTENHKLAPQDLYTKNLKEISQRCSQQIENRVPKHLLNHRLSTAANRTTYTPKFADTSVRCKCGGGKGFTHCDCPNGSATHERTFYLYSAIRTSTRQRKSWGNKNFGSLGGVMYYLHNEVVGQSCPRKFQITEIARVKVTMLNTPSAGFPFEGFVMYDYGMCSPAICMGAEKAKTYTVGCQTNLQSEMRYNVYNSEGHQVLSPLTWYSLPGPCPVHPFDKKTAECEQSHPGGECTDGETMGTNNCTWTAELAGYITLSELYNITDEEYDQVWCEGDPTFVKRGPEYTLETDGGTRTNFWDNATSIYENARRCTLTKCLPQSTQTRRFCKSRIAQ